MSRFAVYPLEMEFILESLRRHFPISLVRYGDGEFQCIRGDQGENCDGTVYRSDLKEALAQTLKKPHLQRYFYSMGPKAAANVELTRWMKKWIRVHAPAVRWYNSEVLLHASLRGELYPFIRELSQRDVLMVGSAHLQKLPLPARLIEVPSVGAWDTHEQTREAIERAVNHDTVVCLSAGMLSKILVWELAGLMDQNVTFLDCGSLWDMYCGFDSRRYARKMTPDDKARLLAVNFRRELENA